MKLSDVEMRRRMKEGWRGGLPYTKCGNGTLPENSRNVYPALARWIEKYGIRSVNDAGCGDKRLVPPVEDYRAFDLFPRLPHVQEWDITTMALPPADLIVCRMVLNHVQERIEQTLPLLRQSGKYLAATQFNGEDLPQRSRQFMRLDLRKWLGDPLESVHDGNEPECRFALWSIG